MRTKLNMRQEILSMLSKDRYVSSQEICKKYGISRTAVWKHIAMLKDEGYIFDAMNNKGYKLIFEPDVITADAISEALTTDVLGQNMVYFDETDSTNLRAKEAGDDGAEDGTLFIANRQRKGRGRRGRAWSSPKGSTISMSLLLKPNASVEKVSSVTIIAALATANAVRKITGLDAKIKWPNDIVVNGKKVCGILTEMSSTDMTVRHIVVGIGINVSVMDFPDELADKATSLRLEGVENPSRNALIAEFLNNFEGLYNQFLAEENLEFIKKDYNKLLVNKGEQIFAISEDGTAEYKCLGLATNGGLAVEDAAGNMSTIISGEVSVRGIYGYV